MAMMAFRPRPRDACLTLPASTPPPAVGPVAPPIAPAPCRFMLPATAPNPPEPAAAEVPATAPTPPTAAVPEARVAPAADAATAPNPSVVHHTGPKLRRAARSRSSSSAWASGCRSLGSLAMARSTTGCRSSPRLPVAVGSFAAGSWAISLSRAPTEYTSLAGVSCSPANASGLAYAPMPAASGWPSQAANSTSFGVPSASIRMVRGDTLPCTTPFRCAYAKPSRAPRSTPSRCGTVSWACGGVSTARLAPSTHSSTSQMVRSSVAGGYVSTMFGCRRRPADSASAMIRGYCSGPARASCLRATSRPWSGS